MAWPSIRDTFGLPQAGLGLLVAGAGGGYLAAGLATGALPLMAAASLLILFHPYDATAPDLAVHAVAVAIVVAANRLLGGRLFGSM